MIITKDTNFVFKTTDKIGDEDFVTLREPTTAEFQKAGFSEDGSNNLVQLARLFPICVVDSSFEKEDGAKATGKEIYDLLEPSAHVHDQRLDGVVRENSHSGLQAMSRRR